MKKKSLLIFLLTAATVMTVVGSGCGGKGGGNSGSHKHSWQYTAISPTQHTVHCVNDGCSEADYDEDHVDTNSDNICDTCSANLVTAKVPEYEGPAAGSVAGEQDITLELNAKDIPTGVLEEPYTDGTFTVTGGEIGAYADTTAKYTHSLKANAAGHGIEVVVPVAGTLTIYYANGSNTKDSTVVYSKDGVSEPIETITSTTRSRILESKTYNVEPGTYKFERGSNTIYFFACELKYHATAAPIVDIEIANVGTTDYLVTQQVDCMNVSIIAKDGNGVPTNVDLKNCEFDISDYNPFKSGEYTIGVTYHLDGNLDSDKLSFTKTFTVKVYTVDSISLSTVGLNGSSQVTVQQAYLTGDTFNSNYITVVANCGFGSDTIEQKLKADWYTVSTPTLTAAGKQTVTVSVDPQYTTGNKAVAATYEIVVKDKKSVENNVVEVTVGENKEFATLTQAVQYLKACAYDSSVNKVIKLDAGTYEEKVWCDIDNVTIMGTGAEIDDTVLSYSLVEGDADVYSGALWALNCATLHVTGKNFKAYNLAIRNDFDYMNEAGNYSGTQAAQGVALTLAADGAVIYKCHLFGNQDTLYLKSGRSYYLDTKIEGNIDFIFGGSTGLGYFENCEIVAINRSGYVSVPQHLAASKPDYGYIFSGCKFTDDGNVGAGQMLLGRPWGDSSTVAYLNCSFTDAYSQTFASMGTNAPENADFCSYNSIKADGTPITTAPTGGKLLTAEQAANYTKANIFGTNNGKVGYSTVFDCDTEYSNLRILAGLDSGELSKDTTQTISFEITPFPTVTVQEMFEGKLLIEGTASWNNKSTYTDAIQMKDVGDKIKVLTPGRISVEWYGSGYGEAADALITYDSEGCATITMLNAGKYIKSITIDLNDIPEATVVYDVTFNYNDEGATADFVTQAITGTTVLKPTNPYREGYTFKYWYAGADDSTEFDFSTPITGAITLTAKWEAGEQEMGPELITAATGFNFGKKSTFGDTLAYVNGKGVVNGLYIEGTTSNNGDWTKVNADTTVTIKVAAGLTVEFAVYKSVNFEVYIGDVKQDITSTGTDGTMAYLTVTAQSSEVEITLKCTAADYIGYIEVK